MRQRITLFFHSCFQISKTSIFMTDKRDDPVFFSELHDSGKRKSRRPENGGFFESVF